MALHLRPYTLLLAAVTLGGCGYGDADDRAGYVGDGSESFDVACGAPEQAIIDAGIELDVEPGAGAGVFIEYEAGGTYRVTTTCDTSAYGGDCAWDIIVSLLDGAPLEQLSPIELEADDTLLFGSGHSVQLVAYTDEAVDGFSLTTEPGAAIRFDAQLDGGCANRYIFWVGDSALHSGAPSNVIDLFPSEP